MKKFILTISVYVLSFSQSAFAAEVVKVNVNGMVCDFCARAIEKVFTKQEAVDTINVDLDEKLITATMKEGQTLDDETVTQLVTDSGYAVQNISRTESDHDSAQ